MPCRSYEADNFSSSNDREIKDLKKLADKLARIACKAMTELERQGVEDLFILKDDEVRTWWSAHKIADAKEAAEKAEKIRIAKIKREALNKLSAEEKRILGIK